MENRMSNDITLPLTGVSGEGQVGQLTAMSSYDPASKLITSTEIDTLALRHELEHSLATAFVKWSKERDPAERTRLWQEMHEMAKELERLDEGTTTSTTT